ncbi:MAG: cytochrome b [Aeromonas sp.]
MKTYYDRLSRYLHWFMAIVIIYATAAGYIMHLVIDNHPELFDFLSIFNMSMATLITPLFLLRWCWHCLRDPLPAEPIPHHKLARMTHALIYFLMFCVLLSGFLMLKQEYTLFWLYTVPNPISSPDLNHFFFMTHRTSCMLLATLVTIHACAALYHHHVAGNRILYRMLGPRSGG